MLEHRLRTVGRVGWEKFTRDSQVKRRLLGRMIKDKLNVHKLN